MIDSKTDKDFWNTKQKQLELQIPFPKKPDEKRNLSNQKGGEYQFVTFHCPCRLTVFLALVFSKEEVSHLTAKPVEKLQYQKLFEIFSIGKFRHWKF